MLRQEDLDAAVAENIVTTAQAQALRAFTAKRERAPRVITDPNPRNARALRAYAKAGFRPLDHRVTISGEAVLMGCDARTPSA
jgi:aminoglycoside 6'-N-acetyltransferase